MKIAIAVSAIAFLLCSGAQAKKPCNPCADDLVGAMVVDLQQDGWWQMVPNGLDPNDATYRAFVKDALLSLAAHLPKGKLDKIIDELEGEP